MRRFNSGVRSASHVYSFDNITLIVVKPDTADFAIDIELPNYTTRFGIRSNSRSWANIVYVSGSRTCAQAVRGCGVGLDVWCVAFGDGWRFGFDVFIWCDVSLGVGAETLSLDVV